MSIQERLDRLEGLLLSTRGVVKILNFQWTRGTSEELQSVENSLGDALGEVQGLKNALGCVNVLLLDVAVGQE